jgi:hypothetical protein
VDVAWDEDAKKWYAVGSYWIGSVATFILLDFGQDLSGTPTVQTAAAPTAPDIGLLGIQVHIAKQHGEWFVFGIGWRLARIDCGNSLANLVNGTATGVVILEALNPLKNVQYGGFTYENGNWYAILASFNSPIALYRVEFGPNLNNNNPSYQTLTLPAVANNVIRGFILMRTCDNILGFMQHENASFTVLDFKGDIKNNAPAGTLITPYGGTYSSMHSVSPFVYRDTVYALGNSWNNILYKGKLMPLNPVDQHIYNDRQATHTFTAPGIYDVTMVMNQGGRGPVVAFCHSIQVNAAPPAQPGAFVSPKTQLCVNESNVSYSVPAVSGATSYEWAYTGSGGGVPATTSTVNPTNTFNFNGPAGAGTVRVRAVNAGGQSAWRDLAVTVNARPGATVAPSGSQAICQGGSLTLNANPVSGANYQWQRNGSNIGTNSSSYSANADGTYRVIVTSSAGCADTSSVTTITVNPLPAATVTPAGNQSICQGGTLQLSATTSSGVSYQWKLNGTNVGTNSPTYNATSAGSYTVTVTNTSTNCAATSSATVVTVNPLPAATVTPSGNQSICQGETLSLSVTAATGLSYQWKQNGANVGTNSNVYDATTAGSYTVTVTNTSTNCSATSAATVVTVNSLPAATINAGGQTDICKGDTVMLTASTGTGYTYEWKNGNSVVGSGSTNTFGASTSGSYKVVVTDGNSCRDSSQTVDIHVYSKPVATLTPGDTAFCDGGVVQLEVSSSDTGLTYVWLDGSGIVPLASAFFLDITTTGNYSVIVGRSIVAGCEDTTNEVNVTVHPLPAVTVTWDGAILHATPGYAGYQWNTGGQGIAGATDSTFQPQSDGGYSVTVTDANGCTATSTVQNVTVGVDAISGANTRIRIYPNPVSGHLYIEAPQGSRAMLMDMAGRVLVNKDAAEGIGMQSFVDGVYMLRITDSKGMPLKHEQILKQ